MLPYQDRTLTPAERAHDLLARLTLTEKVGQLNQRLYGFHSVLQEEGRLRLSEDFQAEVRRFGGLGTLYGLYRADPWSGRTWENGLTGIRAVQAYNLAQRCVLEHSRFGIPMLLSSECPHGHQALDGYLLAVNLAVGATFHPALFRSAGEICGRQLHELGVDFALVSALDVLRDPRWGRSEECYGEDPFHASCFARAIIEGIQSQGVAVVAKHLCAQGETTGGINASAARIGQRELREIHLPVVQAAVEAGVRGFMAAYNEIDGIPCHANPWLLTDLLRGEYQFNGIVMADGCAIDRLDELTGDNVRSGALALEAGVDISLWDTGFARLEEAVQSGYVSEQTLDRSVLRVLTLKFERGLFEHPLLPDESAPSRFSCAVYPQSLEIARESLVLLKNCGILPLASPCSVAVIGPAADDIYRQLGDYSPPVHAEEAVTLWNGLKRLADSSSLSLLYDDGADPERAASVAARADVTILALGGSSSRFSGASFDTNGAAIASSGQMDCGEGVDCAQLRLPQGQHALFASVRARAKSLVSVLILGRPYAIADIASGSDALLCCFYPGPFGGRAIAEVLTGVFSPSGRLPVSFPVHAGQLPVYYNPKSGTAPLRYSDGQELNRALYHFGEGMGYSRISYFAFQLRVMAEPQGPLPVDGTPMAELSMRVRNEGPYPAHAVPMLFVRDMEADVTRRVKELKGFTKVPLGVHEEREVTLVLLARDLSVWNRQMKPELQRGHFRLFLSDGGETLWEGTLTL